jgi:putative ABC transport system permease protein
LIDYYSTSLSSSRFRDEAQTSPLTLHSLREAYFNQALKHDSTNRGNLLLVRVLLAIGSIILLLSVINYANLSTAKASIRNREMGVQKVHGAGKNQLIFQHLTESTLLSFVATGIGVMIAAGLLPWFSQFLDLTQTLTIPGIFLLLMVPFALILGFIAGIYPSFQLSSVNEITILSTAPAGHLKGKNVRHVLVVLQFFISMTLIAVTFLMDHQVSYLRKKDLGIDKDHVLYTRLPRVLFRGNREVFTERILKLPSIEKVSYSSAVLGGMDGYNYLDHDAIDGELATLWVDAAFMDFFDLELVEGRFFSDEFRADMNATALINEAAAGAMNVEDPFAVEIRVPGGSARVVGIVKDFNFRSLHHAIEPLAIIYLPGQGSYANIKVAGSDIPGTLDDIAEIWADLAPGFPFNYHFLDSRFDDLYQRDAKMGKAITLASVIAIIIAVLGVMSLSLFLCESRVKEIALRKINGARVWEVILNLNKAILYNLIVALIVAGPVGWLIMRRWLDNFAYQTRISPWIFILSAGLVSLITFSIISWQSWQFANRNPAETIRYE